MAYDSSRGRTVLFGGLGGAGVGNLGDTWEWDGENWTQMADSGPPARGQAAMAYDVQRNQTVLFGGAGPGALFLVDTWGWDGSTWTQLAVSGPSPRTNFAMAYDSKRQRIVVFGGLWVATGGALLADTWEWDGAAWTQLAVTGPAGRRGHVMAYDSTRDRSVLFGGFDQFHTFGDTWEWNGSMWTQVSDFGIVPCVFASLAFKGDSVALFGGASGTASDPAAKVLGSTWTWNGRNWTLRQDFGPSPRFSHTMCYDSKRGTLVLFGGFINLQSNATAADTWEHSEGP
jgi:hypothetical protein